MRKLVSKIALGILLMIGAGCGAQTQEVTTSLEFNTVDVAIFYKNGTRRRMSTDSTGIIMSQYKNILTITGKNTRKYTILGVNEKNNRILITLDQYNDTVSFVQAPVKLVRMNKDTVENFQIPAIYEVKQMEPELVALGGQLVIIYYNLK